MSLWLSAALVIYMAFVSPLLGKRSYARLERDGRLLSRMYGLWMAELWGMTAVAFLIVGLSPRLDLARTGFAVPEDPLLTVAVLAGVVVATGAVLLTTRRAGGAGGPLPGQAPFEAMIPRTPAERRLALAMSVTAGVCEEIVYRGLLIALGVHLLRLPLPVAAGLALAVFVAGHLYQGWKGMLAVTVAGFALTMLYVKTGSLLLPVIVHALVDVRSLLFAGNARPQRRMEDPATVRG
ncbi:CPBP family intramembrane glutamic endopeptidase [Sphaerisporangium fuscum]|uniref:CPBP family intramembrane glutamic endopeptidase n=1 Tax=Sphaerisporangium fuscum TaxID=2835868 RepID=UPI0020299CDC|nr:CPBP family intramembrane glutamic endopeptidase [Sphaerisporangium fuscum]